MANIQRLLELAGVPEYLHSDAMLSLALAELSYGSLDWFKIKAKLFKAGTISKTMQWEHNRLLEAKPEWSKYDVAPMLNITGHGDNAPWDETTGLPVQNRWLDPNPESEDYKAAVASCYWCPGNHPRSPKARKAWYRRNAGEYTAHDRGAVVDITAPLLSWEGNGIQVLNLGDVWFIKGSSPILGKLVWKFEYGFEINNLKNLNQVQCWYPLPGVTLKAPVVWSKIPSWNK